MWMSDAFAEMMLGHLVCLVQGNAFILVEWAYLGRGKLRWPVLWAELLCMGQLGLSLATGMSFFNVQSVLLNVLYLFVTAQLFGGTFADKLTACLINGTMCLLVENTVNYTYSWFTGVRTGEAWQHPGCLIALCAANLIVGAAVAHSLYSWNQKCALQPLQALVMSFFPGVAVVLNIVLMVTGTQQPATRMTMLLTFGMSVAVLVHIAIVQMFNDQVVQRQNSRYRAQLEQQRAEALLDSYTEQRRLTHEFTNHMTALTALLDQGDLKGAQAYIASVSKTVAAGTTIMDTHNPLLDSILSKKYEEAEKVGVNIYFDLCDLKRMPFDSMDMVIVLSNLLDNATPRRSAGPAAGGACAHPQNAGRIPDLGAQPRAGRPAAGGGQAARHHQKGERPRHGPCQRAGRAAQVRCRVHRELPRPVVPVYLRHPVRSS